MSAPDQITVADLEVFYRVGVPDEERERPQRLSITVRMDLDLRPAAAGDELAHTIDYDAVSRRLLQLGRDRSWKLIETVAEEIAALVLKEFRPEAVEVEIKKFIIREAAWVAVRIRRPRP